MAFMTMSNHTFSKKVPMKKLDPMMLVSLL